MEDMERRSFLSKGVWGLPVQEASCLPSYVMYTLIGGPTPIKHAACFLPRQSLSIARKVTILVLENQIPSTR